jgi:SynChlorMet cassette radical SAM/SPASM protein ScmF
MESQPTPYPLSQLYFYLTEGCNLACIHCWLAPKFDPGGNRYPTLPVETFETAIREARPLGLQGVKLTGGEPLLHPQFTRLLEIVRSEGLRLTIETNGTLCTPEMVTEIVKSERPFVSVSMDGACATTHEKVRGVAGSFDAACQAVRNLAAGGVRPQIIFSVMRHNVGELEDVVRLGETLGAASVKFNIIQPTARGEKLHEAERVLGIAELLDLGHKIETELAKTTPLKLFFDYPQAFRPLSRLASGDGAGVCGIMGILGVLPSGKYALCGIGEQIPEMVFGTVGEDPLAEVWHNHPVLSSLRTGLPGQQEGVCGRCLMKQKCLGSCIAQNYYRTHNLWAPFWFCEEAEEAGLFPASRLTLTSV